VESLEHLAPAALLCVIRVQDLEPTARRAVGSSGSLQDDTLKVLRAANPEQFDGCALQVIGIENAGLALDELTQFSFTVEQW